MEANAGSDNTNNATMILSAWYKKTLDCGIAGWDLKFHKAHSNFSELSKQNQGKRARIFYGYNKPQKCKKKPDSYVSLIDITNSKF